MTTIKRNANQAFPGFFNYFLTKNLLNRPMENSSLTGITIAAFIIRK